MLSALQFRAAPAAMSLSDALETVREMYRKQLRKVPPSAPIGFIPESWRKVVITPTGIDRKWQHGFMISLDDFGTGTANIEWLTVLDFDEIKIDRFFIANIDDPVKRELLVSVVKGLRDTGKPLVFEGVETPGEFEFIRSLDAAARVQGWYTGKPAAIIAVDIVTRRY